MARFFWSGALPKRRKGPRFFLAASWILGWLCGLLFALSSDAYLLPLMRKVLYAPVSIVSLLCVSTVPFLFSAFAVFLFRPILLPVCFMRAFLSGTVSGGVALAYGKAAWLLRILLLFGDIAPAPLLYLLWLRSVDGRTRPSIWEVLALTSAAVLIGSIDHRVISPFLAVLIE